MFFGAGSHKKLPLTAGHSLSRSSEFPDPVADHVTCIDVAPCIDGYVMIPGCPFFRCTASAKPCFYVAARIEKEQIRAPVFDIQKSQVVCRQQLVTGRVKGQSAYAPDVLSAPFFQKPAGRIENLDAAILAVRYINVSHCIQRNAVRNMKRTFPFSHPAPFQNIGPCSRELYNPAVPVAIAHINASVPVQCYIRRTIEMS